MTPQIEEESVAGRYASLRAHLNERGRRLFAAAEARELGRGGIAAVSRATGLVVRHMVEWMPGMLGIGLSDAPSVDDDPAGAWDALDGALRTALDDPVESQREFDMRIGRFTVERAVDTFMTPDVLIHTWDLARATGLDETLDPVEVHKLFVDMEPYDEVLRTSGQYGPRVIVPDDADEQTKLIAFTGRRP